MFFLLLFSHIIFFLAALVSGLVSFYLVRFVQRKLRERRRMQSLRYYQHYRQGLAENFISSRPEQFLQPTDYIGNLNCEYNAHSAYLRCAVNPMGPCEDCPSYKPRSQKDCSFKENR